MPHHGLHHLRVGARHRQPRPAGVPQGVKVQHFAGVVSLMLPGDVIRSIEVYAGDGNEPGDTF